MIFIYDANAYLRQALNRGGGWTSQMDPRVTYERANANPHPEFWVWDGENNNERRRALFPGYKIRDYTGQENIFAGLALYRELLIYSKAIQIEVPRWEADDVCATLAKHFAAKGERVVIFTNDFDFHQLHAIPGIEIRGMKPIEGVAPRHVALFKALKGDSSDKIPGLPGFGPRSWTGLVGLHDHLDHLFATRDIDGIRAFEDWRPNHRAWLADDVNVQQLLIFYQIVKMMDVPIEDIERHMYPGIVNPAAAYQLFEKFSL